MDVFEGKSWISGQGLVHTCIGVDEGKITAVKKILKGDNHTKFDGIILNKATAISPKLTRISLIL